MLCRCVVVPELADSQPLAHSPLPLPPIRQGNLPLSPLTSSPSCASSPSSYGGAAHPPPCASRGPCSQAPPPPASPPPWARPLRGWRRRVAAPRPCTWGVMGQGRDAVVNETEHMWKRQRSPTLCTGCPVLCSGRPPPPPASLDDDGGKVNGVGGRLLLKLDQLLGQAAQLLAL